MLDRVASCLRKSFAGKLQVLPFIFTCQCPIFMPLVLFSTKVRYALVACCSHIVFEEMVSATAEVNLQLQD